MKTHILGFPRIGSKRELKFAQESFWKGEISEDELLASGEQLRVANWNHQSFLDLVPVGDFSFYDHILDMSFTLGNIPKRAQQTKGSELDQFFRVARGRSANDRDVDCIHAGEMTKWLDTNYHYIVPEFDFDTHFSLNPQRIISQLAEAREVNAKPVIVGPVTYLWLGKEKDESNKKDLLDRILPVYKELLDLLAASGVEWVQIDEPILVAELDSQWQEMFKMAYDHLSKSKVKILLATYFGKLQENLSVATSLPVEALHIDAVRGREEVKTIIDQLPQDKQLSLGVIDGRNIWKTDLVKLLNWLEPIAKQLGDRLWIAPSCSLLHVPVDLDLEEEMDSEIKSWLAYAMQKLEELKIITRALKEGRDAVKTELSENYNLSLNRRKSTRVNNPEVQRKLLGILPYMLRRESTYKKRAEIQRTKFQFPIYPTTTIGSFPQTKEIRSTRLQFKKGELDIASYKNRMKTEIKNVIRIQEELGLDVLVHGEAERNDMVEYFGEHLDGYVFSEFGWVQSYGSRCVKPPIIFGDISRSAPITVDWITYAQSLTSKPMKGMLTGPVTILNWSFVRDDIPRSVICNQIALAIRDEVLDLEKAGIHIIQIDEAALREGLPLRKSEWNDHLNWAVDAFKITANGVSDSTQIHTHMCYSEFNDIISSIADMDADVITIETSRSDMELLDIFDQFSYPNEIGPGVYDIHSPNIPTVNYMVNLMKKAAERIPAERLWVNPDCGLKTRGWPETVSSLKNMVEAASYLR